MAKFWWLAAVAVLGACAPSPAPPMTVMAMVEGNGGTYQPQPVQLNFLSDVVSLKGTVANFVGGARIVVDQNDPALQTPGLTDAQVEAIFLKNAGGSVSGSYIQKDNVYWPADFDTWNMVTAYYNFEQAFNYFQAFGVFTADSLTGATVYYFPSFTLTQTSPAAQTDNTLFYSPVQGFLILPFDKQLQLVPLAMNSGILAHEYSHRVFNLAVYNGEPFPQPLSDWLQGGAAQVNLLKAIDEGIADFHAYGASCATPFGCTTRFLEPSFGATIADQRDMSQGDKCMTSGMVNALCSLPSAQFISQGLQYQVGTTFAAALYHAGKNTSQTQVLEKALLASYNDSTPASPGIEQLFYQNLNTQQNVTLGAVVNILLLHIGDPSLQRETCNQFMDHMQLLVSDICPAGSTTPCGCPPTASGGTTCPNINPTGNALCPGF